MMLFNLKKEISQWGFKYFEFIRPNRALIPQRPGILAD